MVKKNWSEKKNLEDVKNSLALPGGRKFVEIDKLDYRFGMGEEEQREQRCWADGR